MFAAFLAQYAAGCFLAVAGTKIHLADWRYVRLTCIVSASVALLALFFQFADVNDLSRHIARPETILIGAGLLLGLFWLFVNAAQQGRAGRAQRLLAAIAGAACLGAALMMALSREPLNDSIHDPRGSIGSTSESGIPPRASRFSRAPITPLGAPLPAGIVVSTILAAGLLGVATTAMLLGHRYLTDTGMTIVPLKSLTNIYLALILARIAWAAVGTTRLFTAGALPSSHAIYFWLALSVRILIGLLVAGIFAFMIRDCVRRRATQSATALYYLSMLFIFSGELSAQYLLYANGLTL
ncbi:MAG TPA: hypothetical protein VNT79_16030 [Phycisphaerae bacterium]|nr:hypothetical protein [Phycisphaerae bacterium]